MAGLLSVALLLCLPSSASSFCASPAVGIARSSSSAVACTRQLAMGAVPGLAAVRQQQRAAAPAMMAKKVSKIIKLALYAGKANPAPPVGPALGAAGVNIMMFCKECVPAWPPLARGVCWRVCGGPIAPSARRACPTPPARPRRYNARTSDKAGTVIPVEITVFEDRSFTFILKTPPAAELLKKAAKVQKGSGEPAVRNKAGALTHNHVGSVTMAQIEEIAKIKMPDLNTNRLQSAMNTVKGTAKNMGSTQRTPRAAEPDIPAACVPMRTARSRGCAVKVVD